MAKYFLKWKGQGKFKFPVVESISETKANKLMREGVEVFNSRPEALERAMEIKKG